VAGANVIAIAISPTTAASGRATSGPVDTRRDAPSSGNSAENLTPRKRPAVIGYRRGRVFLEMSGTVSIDTRQRLQGSVTSSRLGISRGRTLLGVLTCTLASSLAACGDSTSPASETPANIEAVSGAGQSGAVGTTLTSPVVFEVTSATDAPVAGIQVNFAVTTGTATVSPANGTTDADGNVSTQITLGASAGSVEVTATVQGRSLSARAAATATQIATDCSTASTALTLGQVLTGLGGASLCVSGGASGGEFALVPFNASLDGSSRASLAVQASGIGATAVASLTPTTGSFNMLAGGSLAASPLSSIGLTRELDARLRAIEARELAPMIAGARTWMTRRQRTTGAVPGLSLSVIPSTARVGDLVKLNTNSSSACSAPDYRTGRVAAVSNKAIIIADTANPASGFTDADYASIASSFDNLVDPTDTKAFGSPTDIDGNGHVVMFFTRAVNELTPRNSTSYVAGFFFARDLFPATATADFQACASSNGGEMFYLLVPDPTGVVNGNKFTKANVTSIALATVGHEYEHLINASRRMYINTAATDFEETWLDEGLAHVAEELLFLARTGLLPRANIDATLLRSSATYVDAFNDEAISNFSRLGRYLATPASNSPFADNDELETRGATWSFLRYAADHTGSDDGTTWFQLVNSTTTGVANLTNVFGTGLTSLARDWATSVFADDIATTDARYQQPTWNFRSIYAALQSNGAYPLATTSLSPSASTTVSVKSGSAAYLRFSVAAGQTATIQWNTLPSNMQLTLVRTR
jgi:hypothetical protein